MASVLVNATTVDLERMLSPMRIDVNGDESISRQARAYAEYRLFAALSGAVDSRRVRRASLLVRRAKTRRRDRVVLCTVTVEWEGGGVTRLTATGDHPYAAINRTADRLRPSASTARGDSLHAKLVAGTMGGAHDEAATPAKSAS